MNAALPVAAVFQTCQCCGTIWSLYRFVYKFREGDQMVPAFHRLWPR